MRCSVSLKAHCFYFHGELFSKPFSKNHERFFEVYDDPSIQRIVVLAHRGFGKTTIFNVAAPSQAIIFDKAPVIVPISATSTLAELISENLKYSLENNEAVAAAIGQIKGDRWTREEWDTGNGHHILPRGTGQQIRGVNWRGNRLGLGIGDDLETRESVKTKESREALKKWFLTDFYAAVDKSSKDWRIVVVGTVLHNDCLLMTLRNDPLWTCLEFPLCDPQYQSYWPIFMDNAAVAALAEEYRRNGMITEFSMEYMNIANPTEDATFKQEMFKYFEPEELPKDIESFVIVDPARTVKTHSDFTAIVGVSYSAKENKLFVRDIVNRRMHQDETFNEMFGMAERVGAKILGYEETGLHDHFEWPLTNEILRRGLSFELVPLRPYTISGRMASKGSRIGALAPLYRMGLVFHNRGCCAELESQLLAHPMSDYDDVADCLAYAPQMLNKGERFMDELGGEKMAEPEEEPEDDVDFDDGEPDEDAERGILAGVFG